MNDVDNCPNTANVDQADCDSDGVGNACEAASGNFVRNSVNLCYIDEDGLSFGYFRLEEYSDVTYVDTSSCNAPPRVMFELTGRQTFFGTLTSRDACDSVYGFQVCQAHFRQNNCQGQ